MLSNVESYVRHISSRLPQILKLSCRLGLMVGTPSNHSAL